MAALEGDTGDDAALFLSPRGTVHIGGTGISDEFSVRTAGRNLPTVTKFKDVCHCLLGACSVVIFTVAIKVSTQTTDFALRGANTMTVVIKTALVWHFHLMLKLSSL